MRNTSPENNYPLAQASAIHVVSPGRSAYTIYGHYIPVPNVFDENSLRVEISLSIDSLFSGETYNITQASPYVTASFAYKDNAYIGGPDRDQTSFSIKIDSYSDGFISGTFSGILMKFDANGNPPVLDTITNGEFYHLKMQYSITP